METKNIYIYDIEILIIEDDKGLNNLISKSLKRNKFKCIQLFSGKDALKAVSPGRNQLLIVDYRLPDMTGKEFIVKLKEQLGITPDFITMTGFGDEKIAVEMMKLGAKDYIIKETNFIEILTEKLGRIVEELGKSKENERYKILLHDTERLANVGGWLWFVKSNKWIMSENWMALHGCFKESFTSNDLIQIAHPDDLEIIQEAFNKTATKGEPYQLEHRIIRPDNGETRYIKAYGKAEMDDEGNVNLVSGAAQDITERKNAIKDLRDSEEKFRSIFENSALGIFRSTPKGRYEEVNEAFARILGFDSPKKMLNEVTDISKLYKYSGDREKIKKELSDKGFVKDYEVVANHPDKDTVWISVNASQQQHANGCIYYEGTIQDITEKKIAELGIKLNEKRMESLLRISQISTSSIQELFDIALHEAIDLTDSSIGYIYFYDENKQQFTLNTWSKEVMKECQVMDPKTTYNLNDTGCWGEAVRQRRPIVINDYKVGDPLIKGIPDGHVKLEKFLTIPVIIEDKIVAVAGVANKKEDYNNSDIRQLSLLMDSVWKISERTTLINDLKQAKENAEKNEFELNEAQKISHVGNWQYNFNSQESFWSAEMLRIWGLNSQDDIPKNDGFKKHIHTDDWNKFDEAVDKAVNKGIPYQMELRIIRPDGEQRTIISIGEPLFDEHKNIFGLRGTAQDITSRKKIENDLITAKEKAEESDRLKSSFLANMSHEIRTPMNSILGFTELLKQPDLSGEEKDEFIDVIHRGGERLLNTVTDLVDISKIEAGLVKVSKTELDVNRELESMFSFFEPEAIQKGLEFSLEKLLPEKDKTIITDKTKFQSILTNLIKNAIKYTRKGAIKFGSSLKNNQLEFYVKDTGIGIPKDRQQAIFNRFEQADIADTHVFEGSGLGLSIVKAYAKMLDGNIYLESEVGVGSKFRFICPFISSEKNEQNKKNNIPAMNEIEKQSKLKILIVEDDESSILHLSIILKNIGEEIVHANNGLQAVELCKEGDFDLILMDLKIPQMNGYEAVKEIRKFNKNVVIIAQTAYALAGDSRKAINAGCNDYISKPINRKILLQKINELT